MMRADMSRWVVAVGLSLLAASGCDNKGDGAKGEGGAEAGGELDPGQEFLLETAQKDLAEIKANISKSDFDPKFDCVSVKTARKELAAVKGAKVDAFRAEADKMCGLEAWIAYAKLSIVKIEADRAKEPALPSSDCAHLDLALEGIDGAHAAEPRVVELKKKQKELCPE